MTANTYGSMLFYRRKQLGFSAAEICSGICSLSTYSHYENDEIRPDLFTMSVFPERMGLDTSHIQDPCKLFKRSRSVSKESVCFVAKLPRT